MFAQALLRPAPSTIFCRRKCLRIVCSILEIIRQNSLQRCLYTRPRHNQTHHPQHGKEQNCHNAVHNVPHELRIHPTRMNTSCLDSFWKSIREFHAMQNVAELGITIRLKRNILSLFPVNIIIVDVGRDPLKRLVRTRGQHDDTRGFRCNNRFHKQLRKKIVSNMVGSELHFKSLGSTRKRWCHHSRVIDEAIQLRVLRFEGSGKLPHGCQRAQVALHHCDISIRNFLPN
mmetsp:Transcript_4812/g.5405  ORF Transcript_4812/g.5405 Transcript_4812/m.5405 type:complete len:230 (+) Transcript_4812:571-1260(+)